MTIARSTRHTSVARELDEVEFEAGERAFNVACDFLEVNGHADAAAALERFAFESERAINFWQEGRKP